MQEWSRLSLILLSNGTVLIEITQYRIPEHKQLCFISTNVFSYSFLLLKTTYWCADGACFCSLCRSCMNFDANAAGTLACVVQRLEWSIRLEKCYVNRPIYQSCTQNKEGNQKQSSSYLSTHTLTVRALIYAYAQNGATCHAIVVIYKNKLDGKTGHLCINSDTYVWTLWGREIGDADGGELKLECITMSLTQKKKIKP